MANDFGISELVTLAQGFARAALRVVARGQYNIPLALAVHEITRHFWPPM